MAEKDTANGASAASARREVAEAFLAQLTREDRMLLILKKELYDGSWEAMRRDLESRLEGKPYIFKLANRIQDDIARISRLESFESENRVSLSDFLPEPTAEK